jgi:hypothetical protein
LGIRTFRRSTLNTISIWSNHEARTGSQWSRTSKRFGGGLNLNVHYHTLLFDGVFLADRANDALDFRPTPAPTDEQIGVCSHGSPRGEAPC